MLFWRLLGEILSKLHIKKVVKKKAARMHSQDGKSMTIMNLKMFVWSAHFFIRIPNPTGS